MSATRIPEFTDKSFDGILTWFAEMSARDLIFHPDDAPETIVSITTGVSIFTVDECQKLDEILSEMFDQFDDDVYEAAYPSFMKRMDIQLDA